MSIISWHKKSSYGSFFNSTIGGLFFLLSIFYGLFIFIPSVCFCRKTKKVFDILTVSRHYGLPLAILLLLRQPLFSILRNPQHGFYNVIIKNGTVLNRAYAFIYRMFNDSSYQPHNEYKKSPLPPLRKGNGIRASVIPAL